MPTFEHVTTPTALSERLYEHEIPVGWNQGRGAFGGLVLASMVRAAQASYGGPERSLRTLTAELCGPVLPGKAQIELDPVRLGSGTSTIAARLSQAGEVLTHAVMVFGKTRPFGPRYDGLERPSWPAPSTVPPLPSDEQTASFAHFFEYRNTGPIPFSGASEAHTAGFIWPREPGALRDDAFIVGLADAWWPALLSLLDAPRPAATLTFTLDIVANLDGLPSDGPLYHDARTLVARDGFAPEVRTLWGMDGRLVAINHQTFVVIK